MISKDTLPQLLKLLDFKEEGASYSKTIGAAVLKVDTKDERITYPDGLTVNGDFTCNFSSSENFVVLECVTRLLEKGYKAEHIELEPKWKLGHGASGGRADILVSDNQKKPLLLIECKTAGREFDKAWRNTLQHGDQLFSYAQQISETQFLCLYTSDIDGGALNYTSHIIAHRDNVKYLADNPLFKSFSSINDVKERFSVWRETYKLDYTSKGVFESNIQPYHIGKDKYSLDDLQAISAADQQKKYHEFATILRQHNVSGRENAFDKLVNLFLCKLVDETENPTDLKFYWKGVAYDTHFELIDRLQQLYQAGMGKFLGEDITYINQNDVNNALRFIRQNPDATQRAVWNLFIQQKFFTNNDFSLIDVHNEKLFYQNADVLLKILQMWQDIRLTNPTGHNQFLGDMFEGFLDQGVKQSEGQYFTPMPICRFIMMSLPLQNLIQNSATPPKAIDYACGAGHFLNELALQIKPIAEQHKRADLIDYHKAIFGVEKEYRLSKVAKVSAFMYGQQNINICYGDALINQHAAFPEIKDGSFDLLVANPPYSVKGFLETLPETERKTYELFTTIDKLDTANSIETFFIERAKQLLKAGGIAALILPSSILSNGGNTYVMTREILLQYFDLVAIAEFGSGTFGKTGTNTVTLFLRRKKTTPDSAEHYRERVAHWFDGVSAANPYQDVHLISHYAAHIGCASDDYQTLLSGQPNAALLAHDTFVQYRKAFDTSTEIVNLRKQKGYKARPQTEQEAEIAKRFLVFIQTIERDKLYHFVMASDQPNPVLIIRSPNDNKAQKQFLGYEWSSAKGNEGIQISKDADGHHLTLLYDETNRNNVNKINSLIAANFETAGAQFITPDLSEFASTARLVDILDFSRVTFEKQIVLAAKKSVSMQSKSPLVRLSEVASFEKGVTYSKRDQVQEVTTNVILTADNITLDGRFEITKQIFLREDLNLPTSKRLQINDIFICLASGSRSHVGKVALIDKATDHYAGGFMGIIRTKDSLLPKVLFEILNSIEIKELIKNESSGSNIQNLSGSLVEIKIPLPPLDVQHQIVTECVAVDTEAATAEALIQKVKNKISLVVSKVSAPMKKLSDITSKIGSGATPKGGNSSYKQTGIALIRSQNIYDDRFKEKGLAFIDEEQAKLLANVTVELNDVLFNITGASVARCYMADAKYLPARVNQHVAIIRATKEVHPKYLHHILISPSYKKSLLDLAGGSLSREAITKSQLEEFKVPVPSLADQQKLVAEIEALERDIASAQAVIAAAPAKKQAIMQRYL